MERYKKVKEVEVPASVNVNVSTAIYKLMVVENTYRKRLNARIYPHGNREREKYETKKDLSTAHFETIRLVLSVSVALD